MTHGIWVWKFGVTEISRWGDGVGEAHELKQGQEDQVL